MATHLDMDLMFGRNKWHVVTVCKECRAITLGKVPYFCGDCAGTSFEQKLRRLVIEKAAPRRWWQLPREVRRWEFREIPPNV